MGRFSIWGPAATWKWTRSRLVRSASTFRWALAACARGRITEIYGPESSGKTTLCLHVAAEAQKSGGICAFIDMEHALDPAYAEKIGVDIQQLYVSQPDTGEQALEITEHLVRSGALDVIIIDSVAALVPRGRDRRRDGGYACWLAGALDEPGAAQAGGRDQAI